MREPIFKCLKDQLKHNPTPQAIRISEQLDRLHNALSLTCLSRSAKIGSTTKGPNKEDTKGQRFYWSFATETMPTLVEDIFHQDPLLTSDIKQKLSKIKQKTLGAGPFIDLLKGSIDAYLSSEHVVSTANRVGPTPQAPPPLAASVPMFYSGYFTSMVAAYPHYGYGAAYPLQLPAYPMSNAPFPFGQNSSPLAPRGATPWSERIVAARHPSCPEPRPPRGI